MDNLSIEIKTAYSGHIVNHKNVFNVEFLSYDIKYWVVFFHKDNLSRINVDTFHR